MEIFLFAPSVLTLALRKVDFTTSSTKSRQHYPPPPPPPSSSPAATNFSPLSFSSPPSVARPTADAAAAAASGAVGAWGWPPSCSNASSSKKTPFPYASMLPDSNVVIVPAFLTNDANAIPGLVLIGESASPVSASSAAHIITLNRRTTMTLRRAILVLGNASFKKKNPIFFWTWVLRARPTYERFSPRPTARLACLLAFRRRRWAQYLSLETLMSVFGELLSSSQFKALPSGDIKIRFEFTFNAIVLVPPPPVYIQLTPCKKPLPTTSICCTFESLLLASPFVLTTAIFKSLRSDPLVTTPFQLSNFRCTLTWVRLDLRTAWLIISCTVFIVRYWLAILFALLQILPLQTHLNVNRVVPMPEPNLHLSELRQRCILFILYYHEKHIKKWFENMQFEDGGLALRWWLLNVEKEFFLLTGVWKN
ncbi:hypothetical protein C8R44DRAFT_747080 [Mycena epipterygia]|nr:hypothetical protein C8R44DRAFT_747080 [Mycena epipterygia]